jgi:hypothetical protein
LSITIGYLATSKGRKDPNTGQRMRILLDSGCAATLINHYSVKILESTLDKKKKWITKAGNFTTNRKCEIIFTLQHYINIEKSHGSDMLTNQTMIPLLMT